MSLHLMNGAKAPRVKNSEGCTVLDCGCAFIEVAGIQQWVQMCHGPESENHYTDWLDTHARAHAQHVRGRP
jgi:hypothetical protein